MEKNENNLAAPLSTAINAEESGEGTEDEESLSLLNPVQRQLLEYRMK